MRSARGNVVYLYVCVYREPGARLSVLYLCSVGPNTEEVERLWRAFYRNEVVDHGDGHILLFPI